MAHSTGRQLLLSLVRPSNYLRSTFVFGVLSLGWRSQHQRVVLAGLAAMMAHGVSPLCMVRCRRARYFAP